MKKLFLAILLSHSFFCIGQEHRSEIVSSTIHFELRNGNLSRIDTTVIQINERMGDNDTNVAFIYSKGDKVNVGKAWIEDMNGNVVRKLKNNEIEDGSYIPDVAFYSDTYIKHFQLRHNSYPYRVFYTSKRTYNKYTSLWDSDFSNRRQPISEQKIIVETTIDEPLKYKQANIEAPKIDTLSKTLKYTWKFSHTPLKGETNASINSLIAPRLTILPNSFKFGEIGSWDNWQSFGNWIFRLNSKKEDLPDSEKNKIDDMLKGIADNKEKAKILYHYLQDNHRYINVSIKTGGLESHPASYVCANRYGDCKALSNYMMCILNHAGIKSFYTLVDSDDKITDIDTDFPSNAFNHVILTVPFGKDTTYLECTNKYLPFGYIHSSIQGRKALMIEDRNSRFTNIPSTTPDNVLCRRSLDIKGNTTGTSSITLTSEQKGPHFELSTALSTSVNKNDVDKYMRNTILSGSYELLDFAFDRKDRDTNNIKINANIKTDNIAKKYGNNIMLNPFSIDIPLYEKPETRKQYIQLDMPEYYIDTIKYKFSDINSIDKIPDNVNIDSPYGKYSLDFALQGNILIVTKKLLIMAGRYDLKTYKEFYEFISNARNYENQKLNIQIQ